MTSAKENCLVSSCAQKECLKHRLNRPNRELAIASGEGNGPATTDRAEAPRRSRARLPSSDLQARSLQHAGNQTALLAIGGKGLDVTSTLVPPRTTSGGPRNILTDGARRGGRPTGTDLENIPRTPGDAMPPDPMRLQKK